MRKIKKKKLSLQKINIAFIEDVHSIKGKSGNNRTVFCSTKTYPPDMCMHTLKEC